MEHYEFISKTDKKSLFNQIKFLVTCGQESFQNDLTTRRQRLKKMLDDDEKHYEGECVSKIKSRVDENIRERQESLLAMKLKRTKETEKFVAAKKVHQYMTNSIEIRDELRKKDCQETQMTQLEQMDDKMRAIVREKKDDEFWMKTRDRLAAESDRRQRDEERLKRNLQAHQTKILDSQIVEHRGVEEQNMKYCNEQRIALALSIQESLQREKEKAHANKRARSLALRRDLTTICEQQKELALEAETFEEVFHEEQMRQVRKEMEEAWHKNDGVKRAMLDYLTYLKKFRRLESHEERQVDERRDQLASYFDCYKGMTKKKVAQKKRQDAETTHKVVLKQICEEVARRMQMEAFQRENKIIENRFARSEVNNKLKNREEFKQGLDMQLEELARLQAEEQKKFENEMNRAEKDHIFCEELLKRHQTEGIDYLAPHPNWKLMACYKPSCPQQDKKNAKVKLDGAGDG